MAKLHLRDALRSGSNWTLEKSNSSARKGILAFQQTHPTKFIGGSRLSESGIKDLVANGSPRMANRLSTLVVAALVEQSVTILAMEQYGRVIRGVAQQLLSDGPARGAPFRTGGVAGEPPPGRDLDVYARSGLTDSN